MNVMNDKHSSIATIYSIKYSYYTVLTIYKIEKLSFQNVCLHKCMHNVWLSVCVCSFDGVKVSL